MRAIGWGLVLVAGALAGCKGETLAGHARDAGGLTAVDGWTGSAGGACWASALPAAPQPIQPADTVPGACAVAAAGAVSAWSYPQDPDSNADDRRYIVGRWTACNAPLFGGPPSYPGLEFGANGRWRLLDVDPGSGLYIPVPPSDTTSGFYYLLGSGQLNLDSELPGQGVGGVFHISFTDGMEAINFGNGNAGAQNIYVRLAPSPLNGSDNPPSTVAGNCSLVGDWDVSPTDPSSTAQPFAISFDPAGNFVIGAAGADLCDGHSGYGTYALSPGMFQLTTNVGLGLCAWWFSAGYPATFDASCDHLSLTRSYDNCTGGRGYFNDPSTLTRRR